MGYDRAASLLVHTMLGARTQGRLLLKCALVLLTQVADSKRLVRAPHLTDEQLQRVLDNETALLEWQSDKARNNIRWVQRMDHALEGNVRRRYADANLRGLAVLCLGARAGGEVRAFRSLGAFAVGVDPYPADGGDLVLKGSAQKLQFADSSTDVIFTNVVDHMPDLYAFAHEATRVLKPGGRILMEVALQKRHQDEWAVRDTGTQAFYAEWHAALVATTRRVDLISNHSSKMRSAHRYAWDTAEVHASGPRPAPDEGWDYMIWQKKA